MFQYKVFRQKFLFTAGGMIAVVLLLSLFGFIFFTADWVNSCQREAGEVFQTAESALKANERLIDMQINRIYADRELTTDLRALIASYSQTEYLARRKANSKSSRELIGSFPEDLRVYLFTHAEGLRKVELHSADHANLLIQQGGFVRTWFNVAQTAAELQPNIRHHIAIRRSISDPYDAYASIGELSFWFDAPRIFTASYRHSYRFAAVIDEGGNALFLRGDDQDDGELLTRYLSDVNGAATLRDGLLNRAFFIHYESPLFGYRLIVCIDDIAMLRSNASTLVITIAIFLIIGLLFLLISYYNLRDDARFLGRILHTIDAVKMGDFSAGADGGAYRQNEYGLIASELNDMSRKLQHHILAGYELRIKQKETEMRALQNQINPHFLYNTLETIRSKALVGGDPTTAEAIANLGALYRDIVKRQDIITLREELQLLDTYLRIIALKFPDNFLYQFDVPDEMRSLATVKFWMQPLAENFFIHGFNRDNRYNLFIITGKREEDGDHIEIMDNGASIPADRLAALNHAMCHEGDNAGGSIGLSNVYMRLSSFYGEGFTMKIVNNPEGGICIAILIPREVH